MVYLEDEMVYLEGMPLSAIDAAASPKKIYAVHVDHLNRPIMLTDAAKASVWSASYEPFGGVRSVTGALTQNLGLPGQWFQLEHGLAYNWHRHYDPTTGRYTTGDPLGFVDGPSVFAYAGSGPHTKADPRGLETPTTGTPGSGQWVSSKTYRIFDANGLALCDFDSPGTHGRLEFNIWSWNNGKPTRGRTQVLIK